MEETLDYIVAFGIDPERDYHTDETEQEGSEIELVRGGAEIELVSGGFTVWAYRCCSPHRVMGMSGPDPFLETSYT